MKVVIYGGRRYGLMPRHHVTGAERVRYRAKAQWEIRFLNDILDKLHAEYNFTTVIEGEATGADTLARQWAEGAEVRVKRVPADWDKYARGAGFRRNEQMARMNPKLGIAFPGGNGTADMTKRLRRRGIEVLEVKP